MKTPPPVHRLKHALQLLLLGLLLLPAMLVAAEETVPLDPAVRTGRLPNGLTYYIRQNTKPEKRLELRLAVNAGSVEERDDQRGMAHLLEHMSFRGTTHYPGVELIHHLQSLGAAFGPDINATTSFDETVYKLTIPSDNDEGIRKGLGVLGDWAHGVTLADQDINKERGVVLEEWRMGQGAQQRMNDKIIPVLFKGSKYAERLPIGTKESIEGSSNDSVRSFYQDWYRPDNMTVIVVGDANPDRIEELIKAEFSTIPTAAKSSAAQPVVVPDNKELLQVVVSDKENPYNVALLIWKSEPEHSHTAADYQRDLAEELFSTMLNLRLAERQQQANAPLLHAQSRFGRLMVRAKAGYQLVVVTADGGIEQGVEAAYTEVLRARKYGFLGTELDRAKAMLLKQLEQRYNERDKTPSAVFADTLVRYHLQDDPAAGIEFLYPFAKERLPRIDLGEVNALSGKLLPSENRVIVVQSVEKPQVKIPTEAQVQAALQHAEAGKIDAYTEKKLEGGLLSSRPAPGQMVAGKPLEAIQALELRYANGVRVVLKPTNFQNDQILLSAFRPGGQSVYPDDYRLSAQLATAYLAEAGLGRFSKTELQKQLAGKRVAFIPIVGPYFDGLKGQSSTEDLETLLQLVYLRFAEPRDDKTAYQVMLAQQQSVLKSLRANPVMAFVDDAQRWLYQQHPRTPNTIPNEADWETLSYEKVQKVAHERFENAAGYTFEIVGSFDAKAAVALATTYLGGLPARPKNEMWKDLGFRQIEGPNSKDFYQGKEPQSIVILTMECPFTWDVGEDHRFWSLGNILGRNLLDKLRLQGGKVYNVKVQAEVEKTPYAHASTTIMVPCAPENADKLAQMTLDEIRRIRRDGLTKEEIEKEVESQRRAVEKEMKENDRWIGKLEMIYRDEEPLTRLAEPDKLIALVTAPELQSLAIKYLDPDKFVRATLYPQKPVPAGAK